MSSYRNTAPVDQFAADLLPNGVIPVWEELDVEIESFDTIRDIVQAAVPDPDRAKKILLACDEIMANIVSYSGAGKTGFFCRSSESNVYIGFRDDGTAFDPTSATVKELDFDDMEFGGMGLNMVKELTESWLYGRVADENILILVF